jgi:UTP:GlnB (protein PII) uridylyltransferase
MVNEFQQKGFQPLRIFSMANQRRSDTIRFGTVLEALQKAMPHIPQEIVDLIPDAYQLDIND